MMNDYTDATLDITVALVVRQAMSFPEIERRVTDKLPQYWGNPIKIRQSVWRLVGRGVLSVGTDLQVSPAMIYNDK